MIKIFIAAIIISSFISLPIYFFKKKEKQALKRTEQESWQLTWNRDIERHLVLNKENTVIYEGQAVEAPRMSFERFLNFYSVSPEKWIITTNEYQTNHNFAFYVNKISFINQYDKKQFKKIVIPIYWETPEDLKKYYHWVEEQFEKGDAALYQNVRDESLKKLTNYIQQDLQEKRKQFEEEMRELESRTKQDMEKLEKKREVQLTLEP